MSGLVELNVMLILSSVQLGLYSLSIILGCVRLVQAFRYSQSFLPSFFGIVCFIILIELALQIYQVILQTRKVDVSGVILLVVNIYAMLFEAAAMFILADYWGETSEILNKQSTEQELKQKRHWVRITVLALCAALFTAFVIWAEVTNSFVQQNKAALDVLVLGCQGIAVVIVLWATISQIISGFKMSVALKRYEDWVSSLSTRKVQFCCLFWLSSMLNLLRSLFLIVGTLLIEFQFEDIAQFWLFGCVYSFTNIPILVIYLLGFSTQKEEIQKQSTMIEDNSRQNSPRRRGETQLSETRSSKSSV